MTIRRTDGGEERRGELREMKQEKEKSSDEVEEMLRAAQDELLLKLSVDSHMSRVAPDYLLPDLARRFQALKSRPSPSQSVKSQPHPPPPQRSDNTNAPSHVDPDDLIARFAALKGSSSSSTSTPPATGFDDQGLDNGDEEDEVEKIIRWAKDAARLEPSPPSDDEEEKEDDDDDCDEDGQVRERRRF